MAGGVCMARGCVHGKGVCAWQVGMSGGMRCRGGPAWQGGMCGRGGGRGGMCGRYYEMRSVSGQYASYWNAFLFYNFCEFLQKDFCRKLHENERN